ncbi:MAG: DUF6562 domain-containing protein [Muribaculaceae bacterium]|nr:DUF6562 domain-containing protein [Muribaculaceae bacterium]
MKKYLLGMSAVAMLFATSCQDDLGINDGDASMVEFVVTTPEIATRAYSDGQTATELQYAVYKSNGTILGDLTKAVALNNAEEIHGSTKVNLKLTTGNTYTVVFWAAKEEAPYVVDFGSNLADANMKVCYKDAVSNDEGRDAFYAVETFTVTGAQTETIELRRPFAQINIGTADYADSQKAGYTPTMSAVTVKNLGDQLNFATGKVSGDAEARVFASADIKKDETFPVAGYEYLAMNYVLVGAKKGLVDVEFTYKDGTDAKTRTVGSVPVQRNYRTNIYGQLLTSDVDINVEIVPAYNEPDHEFESLYYAAQYGGNVTLTEDVKLNGRLDIKANMSINFNGKTITSDADYVFIVREGAKLTMDGEGRVELNPSQYLFCPYGDLVIENGTFIRNIPDGYTGDIGSMFVGTKPAGGWDSTGVTINGGYFDGGYYDANAADIEEILAGTKPLVETADDIANRGVSKDKNVVRVALKNNVMKLLNRSNNYFKVYGGTFVGVNPAWGDEGCMLPTTPNYLRPWSYYQGAFLDGQTFHEDGIVLPEGYTIKKGTHEDGRPIYTVTYSK